MLLLIITLVLTVIFVLNYEHIINKCLFFIDKLSDIDDLQGTHSAKKNQNLLLNTSFDDVISGSDLVHTMSDGMVDNVNKSISGSSFVLGDAMIKGVEYIQESNEYIVKFSKQGQKLLKSDAAKLVQKKSGEFIPQLRRGGKFVEHAELTGKANKALKGISKASTLIIGAAHMISGADIAKKLEEIAKKVDFIIADRENERMAELESIYKIVKEMLIENNGNLKAEEVREQKRLLYKLRSNWRRNAIERLNSIKNPEEKYWLKHIFFRKSVDQEVYKNLKGCMADMQNVRSSLYLQFIISYETNTLPNFQANMLQDEINKNQEVFKKLKSKCRYMSKEFKRENNTSEKTIYYLAKCLKELNALKIDGHTNTVNEISA